MRFCCIKYFIVALKFNAEVPNDLQYLKFLKQPEENCSIQTSVLFRENKSWLFMKIEMKCKALFSLKKKNQDNVCYILRVKPFLI